MISRNFTREQCSRGGINRARKIRAAHRMTKTRLLELTAKRMCILEAACEIGIPPSTAHRILRDDRIVPIVPNLHSPAKVPRATDRHHAARQHKLTANRVRALWECYQRPRNGRGPRVILKPARPHRSIVPASFAMALPAEQRTTISILRAWKEHCGEWCGRSRTRERLVLDFRRPDLDYRVLPRGIIPSAECCRSVSKIPPGRVFTIGQTPRPGGTSQTPRLTPR